MLHVYLVGQMALNLLDDLLLLHNSQYLDHTRWVLLKYLDHTQESVWYSQELIQVTGLPLYLAQGLGRRSYLLVG